jgi:F-box protein 11
MSATAAWGPGLELAGGRYQLTERLAGGGMAEVFRATDRRLGAEVVVKAPLPDLLRHPAFATRFAREARALVRLAHPHIVRALDTGEHAGVPYLVLQYLPGGSLRHRQLGPGGQVRPLPVEHLGCWLLPVAQALDFIHTQGFVHRDVKPGNILFDEHGHAYLGDFGVVKALAGAPAELSAELTQRGVVLGTLQYMAPEVFRGKPYDGRADQYALAVTCYEAVAGRWPFEGSNPAQVMVQQLNQKPPALEVLRPGAVPASLARAVEQGLAKEPAERYGSCQELAAAVLGCLPQLAAQPARRAAPALACPRCQKAVSVAAAGPVVCPSCGARLTASPDGLALHVTVQAAATPPVLALAANGSREKAPAGAAPPLTFSLPVETCGHEVAPPFEAGEVLTPVFMDAPPRSTPPPLPPRRPSVDWREEQPAFWSGWKIALALGIGLLLLAALAVGAFIALNHSRKEPELYEDLNARQPKRLPLIVSPQGPYRTLAAALKVAPAGATVRVRPGVYRECLRIDRPVVILGIGPADQIILQGAGGPCLRVRGLGIRLKGLTLRGADNSDPESYALDIRGEAVVEDCHVSSRGVGGVRAAGPRAQPCLRRCRIKRCAGPGLVFEERSGGTVEDCAVYANGGPGVIIRRGANPSLRRCRLTRGKAQGILLQTQARGTLDRCTITANTYAGVQIEHEAAPLLRGCKIHDGKGTGVTVSTAGKGTLTGCELYGNFLSQVYVEGGYPRLEKCTIRDGLNAGLLVHHPGGGTLVGCTITRNTLSGVEVRQGGEPTLEGCVISHGKSTGIYVHSGGKGTFTDCSIRRNGQAGVLCKEAGAPAFRNCRIEHGKQGGVFVTAKGRGAFDRCTIRGNALAGVEIRERAHPKLTACRVSAGKAVGVLVHDRGKGVLEGCEIFDNALPGVGVMTAGSPRLVKCRIHDGRRTGVVVLDRGKGTFEQCFIHGNVGAEVEIKGGAEPAFRKCKIYEGKGAGVSVRKGGKGTWTGCEIYATASHGVQVADGGEPVFRTCTIRACRGCGVLVLDRGKGNFRGCQMVGNARAGVEVAGRGDPTFRKCGVSDGKAAGVFVRGGRGSFLDCRITGNARAGVETTSGGNPLLRRCDIKRNRGAGVWAHTQGRGRLIACDLTGNQGAARTVEPGSRLGGEGNLK